MSAHKHPPDIALPVAPPCPIAGLSKFAGGMLGAAFSPRLMLAVGLMATSVINICFGFTTGVAWWTMLWAMNGGLQVRIDLAQDAGVPQ